MNDWISVWDRLPDKEGSYLVFIGEKSHLAEWKWSVSGKQCYWWDVPSHWKDPTHWKPLDEPPNDN